MKHHPTPLSSQPWRRAAATALLALGTVTGALAQAFPDKPLKVIVGFPPGGAADQIARLVSTPLATALGQPVIVENRAGANGNIAGEAVAKSPADGYTLLLSSGGMVSVNPHLSRMSFDPVKDLTPVASAARVLVYLMARPTLEVKNVQELVAMAKANPGRMSYGSAGNGSSPHLAGEMLKAQTGMFTVHVPYRGAAPALNDLMGGQIDYYFDPGIGLAHAKAGRTKLLAVGSLKRSPLFPDVPTLDESGLKGFDADTVFGFYAPAGTPPAVIAKINTEVNKILATASVKERITALGGEALPLTPAEFGKRGMDDSQRFGAIIRERKITAD
ncbi:MAG: tripartite tricarboxylate transporter substrate binding protein [Hydrogenophaga sp.]|jgi:tripartite-type tricarboxylate transporter receptor subunit TctC|uniref:Bug family tripartite tricarboxylate transporter substrate binding protein n=2 Tax=Hydrogenophaga sp. TaxID=1904254 RepID=UPI0026381262|nr:tripartite tricarboxylate transporter substrate binding protein [Hydrogenophaga sp.]MCW5672001.1 tripartite tricarboxylate transporter substrate binding protein [Hydrogenophaga sp.]